MGSRLISRSLILVLGIWPWLASAENPFPVRLGMTWIYRTSDNQEKSNSVRELVTLSSKGGLMHAAVVRRSDESDRLVFRTETDWAECSPSSEGEKIQGCDSPILFI